MGSIPEAVQDAAVKNPLQWGRHVDRTSPETISLKFSCHSAKFKNNIKGLLIAVTGVRLPEPCSTKGCGNILNATVKHALQWGSTVDCCTTKSIGDTFAYRDTKYLHALRGLFIAVTGMRPEEGCNDERCGKILHATCFVPDSKHLDLLKSNGKQWLSGINQRKHFSQLDP